MALRGVSLFWGQHQPRFYNSELVKWLASEWRVEIFRVPIGIPNGEAAADPSEEMRKSRIVIEAAIEAGAYVLVDWHAHDPYPDEAARCLGSIAQTYGDTPNILYEPWNEPRPQHAWSETIKPYHAHVLEAVRAAAPRAVGILGTRGFCTALEEVIADPIAVENIAYSLHFYAASHRQGLRDRAGRMVSNGMPLFVSEWGTGAADGDGVLDIAETKRWLGFLEAHNIGNINWAIADKDETCAAVRPSASSVGRWRSQQLTPSGRLVRAYLLSRAAQTGLRP